MFVFRAQFFMLKPGLVMLALGLVLTLPLSFGSITVGTYTFSLYWQLLGVTLAVLGLQSRVLRSPCSGPVGLFNAIRNSLEGAFSLYPDGTLELRPLCDGSSACRRPPGRVLRPWS